jgi:hypothetical protein
MADLLACASLVLAASALPAARGVLEFGLAVGLGIAFANALPVAGADGAKVAQACLALARGRRAATALVRAASLALVLGAGLCGFALLGALVRHSWGGGS